MSRPTLRFQALTAVFRRLRRWRMKTLKPLGNIPEGQLRLVLGDRNGDVARAIAIAFEGAAGVEVVEGDLLDAPCDAIVSPANSFGDMGGGIDKAIDDLYRGEAQRRLTAAIADRFFGEMPVGTALVVDLPPTPAGRFGWLVAAPTMRIPGNVSGSINAYLSMRAALTAAVRFESNGRRIRSLAVPGLGTGVGGLAFAEAARQMRTAFDSVIEGGWQKVIHPAMAPFVMREQQKSKSERERAVAALVAAYKAGWPNAGGPEADAKNTNRLSLELDFWDETIGAFEPQKVITRLHEAFPNAEIDLTDHLRRRLLFELDYWPLNDCGDRYNTLVRNSWHLYQTCGPSYHFAIVFPSGRVTGSARRLSIEFLVPVRMPTAEQESLIAFLRSLRMGEPKLEGTGDAAV